MTRWLQGVQFFWSKHPGGVCPLNLLIECFLEMNVGDCVYLRLEGFNPSWRQAVVVAGKKNGSLRLGVRVTANEADTKAGLLTSFSVGGETFILVEGSLDRLRPACTQAHRSLEVDHALV